MILTKPLLHPQQRLDLEDLLVLFSSITADSKFMIRQFFAPGQYVMKGFAVSGLGGASPATVDVTGATFINANNSGDFSWFTSDPADTSISVALNSNTRNYLELALTTQDGTPLTRAFWDPSANSGAGAEFSQTVNTVTNIKSNVVVLTGGFSGSIDRVPLAIVDTDGSNNIKLILDKRPLFGRLGTPGAPTSGYSWASQTEPEIAVNLTGIAGTFVVGETATFSGGVTARITSVGGSSIGVILPSSDALASGQTVTGGTSSATATVTTLSSAFTGADKSLSNIRDLVSALQNEVRALKGSQFWFEQVLGSTAGLSSFINSVLSPASSNSIVSWDGMSLSLSDTNGSPALTDTIARIRMFGRAQNLKLSRQDATGGSTKIPMADGQVLFVVIPASGDQTYSGVGSGSSNFQVVNRDSFVRTDANYWLAYREGNTIIFRNTGDLSVGESAVISNNVPATLLQNIGLADEETPPSYSSNVRGTANENIVSRVGVLTDAVGDSQEDRSAYLRSDNIVLWDGSTLSFASDIILEILNTKSGTLTQHKIQAAASPLSISNGDSVWVAINRASATENVVAKNSSINPIPAQSQANKDVFVLFRRVDAGGVKYLHLPFMKQMISEGQAVRLGQSGSGGSGIAIATFCDPVSTTLPSGVSVTVDGQNPTDGDTVLFTNLASNSNEIYKISGVGTSIVWTPVRAFDSQIVPTLGVSVRIQKGDSFANQLGEYDGVSFKFNDVVRYFSGADYWEQSSIKSLALPDNASTQVFSIPALGSENIIMDFSIIRGGAKETASLYITQDGTTVNFSTGGAFTGLSGISFQTVLSAGNLILNAITDSSGVSGTIKYMVKRWSDLPGGPGGIPAYSITGGGGGSGAAGGTDEIQFNAGAGLFGSDSRFLFDSGKGAIGLNGLDYEVLSAPATLLDSQAIPVTCMSFSASIYRFAIIEYSIQRNTDYQVGRLLVVNNGTTVIITDDHAETAPTGVTFSAILSGGNVLVQYTTTSTGNTATLKCSKRKWS